MWTSARTRRTQSFVSSLCLEEVLLDVPFMLCSQSVDLLFQLLNLTCAACGTSVG